MKHIEKVFKADPRAIVHLRAQLARGRLGLVFGAGISRDLGFPTWDTLVKKLASNTSVGAADLLARAQKQMGSSSSITRSLSSITQLLFTKFRQKQIEDRKLSEPLQFVQEQGLRTAWLRLIHRELYGSSGEKERWEAVRKHPYLMAFQPLIKEAPLTVTYNFDDSLEVMLYNTREQEESVRTRGYEMSDRPNALFQRNKGVIYHPNGYLPTIFEDGASPNVVFSDDAFQDQLITAATGGYIHLSNHLFRNTCLLVGLSLDDTTLQSMLRQNAVNHPGNVHYLIHYIDGELDEDVKRATFTTNFEAYNLYTLFLDSKGISALAALVTMAPAPFELDFRRRRPKYVYYIIGSIGAGKSTAAANFKNVATYDEWIDARRPELAVPESELPPELVEELNEWVASQFMKKNYAVSKCMEGIHLIDRCPLDPLTFGERSERQAKAKRLLEVITEEGSREVENGHIIYLDCGLDEVKIRSTFKHKYWPDEKYQQLLSSISEVYGSISDMSVICTRGRTAEAVAHEIAKIIFTAEYRPVDVGKKLVHFSALETEPAS